MSCRIEIIERIHEVAPHEWNDATRGPFFSHEWLRFVELMTVNDLAPQYFACRRYGKLVAALPAFVPRSTKNRYISYLLGQYRHHLLRLPTFQRRPLVCYIPFAGGKYILSDNAIQKQVLHDLVSAIEDAAMQGGHSEVVFLHVKGIDANWMDLLGRRGYRRVYLNSVGIMTNRFEDFADYLAGLSRRQRKSVKSDLKAFRNSGLKIDECDAPFKEIDRIMELIENIDRRYPANRWKFTKSMLMACFDYMRPYGRHFLVSNGGRPIGCVSLLEKDRLISTYALGLDFAAARNSKTYFNLLYYNTIHEMIARRAPYINFNQMAYKVKESRGCRLMPQYMYVKVLCDHWWMKIWFQLLDNRYRRKFAREYNRNIAKHRRL